MSRHLLSQFQRLQSPCLYVCVCVMNMCSHARQTGVATDLIQLVFCSCDASEINIVDAVNYRLQ